MQIDRHNRGIWTQRRVVREYRSAEGFLDAGERAAYAHVTSSARDRPILDLGVGGGRTVALLHGLGSSYVGLDYVPAMVAACAERYPYADIRLGDARDLRRFADATFGLVCFSFNGLDALDHAGRRAALAEVFRVLKPGGTFWFSTLNLDGMGRRMRPWVPEWPDRKRGALRFTLALLRTPSAIARRSLHYARLKPRFTTGEGWCTGTLSAHDYRLLVHYVTLAGELRELTALGFEEHPLVFDNTGNEILPGVSLQNVFWFQIVARKPAAH